MVQSSERKPPNPRRKPSKPPRSAKPSEHTRPALNPLKKRRRDLRRLLEHAETLPADRRIGYERELATCVSDLENAQSEARRSQMIRKYHMVRFFERKKATRLLKKARRRLAQAEDDEQRSSLEEDVHNREVDLNYTLFYPLNEVYSSLYASKKEGPALEQEKVSRGDPMWKVVEDAMVNDQLRALREGKLKSPHDEEDKPEIKGTAPHAGKKRQSRQAPSTERNNAKRKGLLGKGMGQGSIKGKDGESDDQEDGGGFFET